MPSVQFGTTAIAYKVRYSPRRTLAIHVFPDGSVVVDAPEDASSDKVTTKVKKRGAWILKQQRLFASYPPAIPPRQYQSGEAFRYLGRQYRLKVSCGDEPSAKLKGAYLEVQITKDESSDTAKRLMESWLRRRAVKVFRELLEGCVLKANIIGIQSTPPLKVIRMTRRWGSCTNSGNLVLNPELIAAPKECIEYVILHELCHLRVRNHNPKFYRLLHRVAPNWEALRLKLNKTVELRLEY